MALLMVQAEEVQEARDRASSGDGEVIYHGRDEADEDEEDEVG